MDGEKNMTIREHYSHAIADRHKQEKHKQADERKQIRAKRTDEQQLQRLDANGRTAKKERARLNKRK